MLSISDTNLVTATEAFKSTSKYRRLTNIDNPYFEQMVSQICYDPIYTPRHSVT